MEIGSAAKAASQSQSGVNRGDEEDDGAATFALDTRDEDVEALPDEPYSVLSAFREYLAISESDLDTVLHSLDDLPVSEPPQQVRSSAIDRFTVAAAFSDDSCLGLIRRKGGDRRRRAGWPPRC